MTHRSLSILDPVHASTSFTEPGSPIAPPNSRNEQHTASRSSTFGHVCLVSCSYHFRPWSNSPASTLTDLKHKRLVDSFEVFLLQETRKSNNQETDPLNEVVQTFGRT